LTKKAINNVFPFQPIVIVAALSLTLPSREERMLLMCPQQQDWKHFLKVAPERARKHGGVPPLSRIDPDWNSAVHLNSA